MTRDWGGLGGIIKEAQQLSEQERQQPQPGGIGQDLQVVPGGVHDGQSYEGNRGGLQERDGMGSLATDCTDGHG